MNIKHRIAQQHPFHHHSIHNSLDTYLLHTDFCNSRRLCNSTLSILRLKLPIRNSDSDSTWSILRFRLGIDLVDSAIQIRLGLFCGSDWESTWSILRFRFDLVYFAIQIRLGRFCDSDWDLTWSILRFGLGFDLVDSAIQIQIRLLGIRLLRKG